MQEITVVRKREGVVRGEGTDYTIYNYITGEFSPHVSLAISRLKGELWWTKNTISDRIYYIIEGDGRFTSKNNQVLEVHAEDVVYVPSGTAYHMEGDFKAVLVNAPPFSPSNEEQLSE